MRKYYTTWILLFSLLMGEVHTFWERDTSLHNWIFGRDVPMTISWNVKYVTNQLWYILVFAAMYFYVNNRVNVTTVATFFVFSIIDTLMYFYNFKTYGYGGVYIVLAGVYILIYNWAKIKKMLWQ